MKRLGKYITESTQASIKESILDMDIRTGAFKDAIITCEYAEDLFGPDAVDIVIPEGVVEIDEYTFWHYKKLQKITLPSTLISIGRKAFFECVSLKEVVFHRNTKQLKSIHGKAFGGCIKLREINLPDCIKTIGRGHFRTRASRNFSCHQASRVRTRHLPKCSWSRK